MPLYWVMNDESHATKEVDDDWESAADWEDLDDEDEKKAEESKTEADDGDDWEAMTDDDEEGADAQQGTPRYYRRATLLSYQKPLQNP